MDWEDIKARLRSIPPVTEDEIEAERKAEEARRSAEADRMLVASGFPEDKVAMLGSHDREGILSHEACVRWAVDGWRRGAWLVIIAPPGSGKTMAATALAKMVALTGRAVAYRTFSELLDDDNPPKVGLMVVDDFGRDRWMDRPGRQERAREAIDGLYRRLQPAIILADKTPDDIRGGFDDSVREQILGRIRERSRGYIVVGEFKNRRA